MLTVYKFKLVLTDTQTIQMYENAVLLSVQNQAGVICFWTLCDTDKPQSDMTIKIYGTGHPIDNLQIKFLGTVQVGITVWHVFWEKTKEKTDA